MSQNDRVRAALRRGPVNSTAFMLPDVYDGGKPINRLPARIHDLQTKFGCVISERREANRTSTYTLTFDPELGVERHDTLTMRGRPPAPRSFDRGVVSLGAPSPQGSDGCPSLLRPSEPAPLFDWPVAA